MLLPCLIWVALFTRLTATEDFQDHIDQQNVACQDILTPTICTAMAKSKTGYCETEKTSRNCRKSCGRCGGAKNVDAGSSSIITCKDELSQSICSMMDSKYCGSPKTNKKCKKTCGLCGEKDNLPISTEAETSTNVDSYESPESTDGSDTACADVMSTKQCWAKAKSMFCKNPKLSYKCRKSCGVCKDTTEPVFHLLHTNSRSDVPCKDDMPKSECINIAKSRFCRSPFTNKDCRKACGLCKEDYASSTSASVLCKTGAKCSTEKPITNTEAPCEDLMTKKALCSDLVKKPNFCSHPQQQVNCRKSCNLCGNVTSSNQKTSIYQHDDKSNGTVIEDGTSMRNGHTKDNKTDIHNGNNVTSELHEPNDNGTGRNYTDANDRNSASSRNNNDTGIVGSFGVYTNLESNDTLGTVDVPTAGNNTVGQNSIDDTTRGIWNNQMGNVTAGSSRNYTHGGLHYYSNQSSINNVRNEQNNSTNIHQDNIAWMKPATQSSTMKQLTASLATGMSISGFTGCAQTSRADKMPWWRVDLGRVYTISNVTITNSDDTCCCKTLLKVSIDLFMESQTGVSEPINCNFIETRFRCGEQRTVECMPNTFGRYLKISKSLAGLSLCAVKVMGSPVVGNECPELRHANFPDERHRPLYDTMSRKVGSRVNVKGCRRGMSLVGKPLLKCLRNNHWDSPVPICLDVISKNIAYQKPSFQSSQGSGPALNAVDGLTVSNMFYETCSATSDRDTHPWWRVQLGDIYTIHDVTIVNRHDQHCRSLSNLTVSMIIPEEPANICATNIPAFWCGETRTIHCNTNYTKGAAVQISKPTAGLYLCEVIVRGVKAQVGTVECEPIKFTFNSSSELSRPLLNPRERSVGTVVTMSCPPGKLRVGPETTACLPDGKWRDSPSFCMYQYANIAYQKQTKMSSMAPGSRPELVVDGVMQSGNCPITASNDRSPWIIIDLGNIYEVKTVYLIPAGISCTVQLTIYVVKGFAGTENAIDSLCGTRKMAYCNQPNQIDCDVRPVGRALRIAQSTPFLSLCEVIVLGKEKTRDCPPLLNHFNLVRGVVMPAVTSHERAQGTVVQMSCSSHYKLLGEQTTECMPDGKWTNPTPLCIEMETNIAFKKAIRISSARPGTSPSHAVDWKIWRGALCAQTLPHDAFPWLKINLGGLYQIRAVVIAFGENTCRRKAPISIKLQMDVNEDGVKKGSVCSEVKDIDQCYAPHLIVCGKKLASGRIKTVQPIGRSVVILQKIPSLCVCEVAVLGVKKTAECPSLTERKLSLSTKKTTEGTQVRILHCARGMAVAGASVLRCLPSGQWDVAIPKCIDMKQNTVQSHPASMSSMVDRQTAALAVDGIFDGGESGKLCSQTTKFDTEPWWQVDMMTIQSVVSVFITNRHDCCCNLLRDFDVTVYGDEELPRHPRAKGQICEHVKSPFECGETRQIHCIRRPSGRYVRIHKKEAGLTLCEVVVIARRNVRSACPRLDAALLPRGLVSNDNLNRLKLSSRRTRIGTKITLGCSHNYKLKGPNMLKCKKPGRWSKQKPECVPTGVKLNFWCPVKQGYFFDEGSDFCFRLETEAVDWYRSVNACSSRSTNTLADLDEDRKYNAVVEAIMSSEKYRNGNFHIGASKFIDPSAWTWMNKKKVNLKRHRLGMDDVKKRCAALSSITGRLIGQPCTEKGFRVCQMEKAKTGPAPCVDSMIPETCGSKAIKGYCDAERSSNRFKTMKVKCKRTCGFCNTHSRRCKDRYQSSSCESKREKGACTNAIVRQKCIKTCGKCPKIIPTTAPPPIGCTDAIDNPEHYCQMLKNLKSCEHPDAKRLCNKTCNVCLKGSCTDENDRTKLKCPRLTKGGAACSERNKRMCSKSCGCPYYTKCGLKSMVPSGEAASPLYPSPYPSNAACEYVINMQFKRNRLPSTHVLLEVLGISEGDSLKVQNSEFLTHAPSNRHEMMSFMVTGFLTVTFKSTDRSSGKGFIIKWNPMAEKREADLWQSCSCTAKEMEIELRSSHRYQKLPVKYSLSDKSCQLISQSPYLNTLKIALTSCHTSREETENYVVYSNTIQSIPQGTGTVHNISVPVKCRFPRTALTSESTGEIPGKERVRVSMDLYSDKRRINTYPAVATTDSYISMTFSTLPMLRGVYIIPQTCFVAMKDSSGKLTNLDSIIKDGCTNHGVTFKRKAGVLKVDVLKNDFLTVLSTKYVMCDVRRCDTPACNLECGSNKPQTNLLRLIQGPILVLPGKSTQNGRTTESVRQVGPESSSTTVAMSTPTTRTPGTHNPGMGQAEAKLDITPPGITDSLPKFTIERTDLGVETTTRRSGDIQLPAVDDQDDSSVSTGTIVGVSVGAVMVTVMGLTLAAIKYGPQISVFKRTVR